MQSPLPSTSAAALQAVRAQDWALAESLIRGLIEEVFDLHVTQVVISRDHYSLNSVNGFVRLADGEDFFFKFHHEAGEEVTLEEFYRGEILKEAGYPVDTPVYVSRAIGRQMLLYHRRTSQRVADLCDRLDSAPPTAAGSVLEAQGALDSLTADIYRRTLHRATPAEVAAEPIHQLFHHRLHDPSRPEEIGARARRFFWGRDFDLAGCRMTADELRAARWVVNGISYRDSVDGLLTRSLRLLQPGSLARFGAVTAHGDAHNANVWWEETAAGPPRMVFFDPAFAGTHVSALLAEVKATFHNILAHPLWLYHAERATRRYRATVSQSGNRIEVHTDWALSPLRERFLDSKASRLWRPLLNDMKARDLLPSDWRETLRCALFCCPTLVMDLCAGGSGGHTPLSSAIGLAVAVAVGSEPDPGQADVVSRFLDSIDPHPSDPV